MPEDDSFEVYALKYAHHMRRSAENFIGGDEHDAPMPLDYFVWAIRGAGGTYVVDTGFSAEMGRKRNRHVIRPPAEALKTIGIDAAAVTDVIISHMHYDHAGNHEMFPNACYHLQDREMQQCTGRGMRHAHLRQPFEAEDVAAMVRRVFEGRVMFHDGAHELAPGLSLHHIGGHTLGLQVVRVRTRRGWVVVASDATHFYANFEQGRPFPVVTDLAGMLEGFRTLRTLASSPEHVIPGHDPLVLERYPTPAAGLEGIVARLDVAPPRS
jgi:glyoxylase-like metal-dependent hydrolase (beta-lactamase superfamily II)